MRKLILIFCTAGLITACKHDPDTAALPPEAAVLNFPLKDQPCTQGTYVSATQSMVTFQWDAAANANGYELHLKNLLSGAITIDTTAINKLSLTVAANTPYSWYVVSKSSVSSATAKSDTWKFYNSGPGVVNYAPYPAEVISPIVGQEVTATNSKITLAWNGSDADQDITFYDVYFGTIATPGVYKTGLTSNTLADVSVALGTTYYWKVITHDAKGNVSDSGVFQFKVNK